MRKQLKKMLSNLSCHLQSDPKDELYSSSFDLVLQSPSKVNLFFRVLSKRPDGFHEIASLYHAISFFDTLYFQKQDAFYLSCNDKSLVCDDSNLVTRAARLFEHKTGIQANVHVHLIKNIPVQAGLGGGSGNAATALWGLNELYGKPASEKDLQSWSCELGSDVPFFLSHGAAYCQGRGEQLIEVGPFSLPAYVTIVKPREGLSTPKVYKNCSIEQFPARDPDLSVQSFLHGSGEYYNDLEIPAFTILPSLKEMRTMLISSGFSQVIMCGSGTAFFCFGEGAIQQNRGWQVQKAAFVRRKDNGWYE